MNSKIIYVTSWSNEILKETREEVTALLTVVTYENIDDNKAGYTYNINHMVTPIMKTPIKNTFSFMIVFDWFVETIEEMDKVQAIEEAIDRALNGRDIISRELRER